VNYRLWLPKDTKIHLVFHVSLLEKALDNAELQTTMHLDQEEEYEVEEVLDRQKINGQWKYLIKWRGWDTDQNTWEPIKHLKNCQPLVNQYHQANPRIRSSN
jgi:hypothetical protein